MSDAQTINVSPTMVCAQLLLQLHALSVEGKGNSPEAVAACEAMEAPWAAMTEQEQERMGGLSEDLYTLEDGGARAVEMSPGERERWAEESQAPFAAYRVGDYDKLLDFLRRPFPQDVPAHLISFMQARCWELLGEPTVAVLFFNEAGRLDPATESNHRERQFADLLATG